MICVDCDGTGCAVFQYIPYSGRKPKRGIKKVMVSRGRFIPTGVGGDPKTSMTYKEFLKKVPEMKVRD